MRCFFINENLPTSMEKAMLPYGTPIRLPSFQNLAEPVCRHPDMLLCHLDGKLFIHEAYTAGRSLLEKLGISYEISKKEVGKIYPNDIAINALYVNGTLFGNVPYLSEELKTHVKAMGGRICHVKQGYAKCSAVLCKNAVATCDRGLYKALTANGVDALLLPKTAIGIEQYDTGFLGGASVMLDENTVGFFGDITRCEAYESLQQFYGAYGISLVSLDETPLFDYGGAISYTI